MTVLTRTILCLIVISSTRCEKNEPTKISIPSDILTLYQSLGGSSNESLENSRLDIQKTSNSKAVTKNFKNGNLNDVQIIYANNRNSSELELQVPESLDLQGTKKLILYLVIDCEPFITSPITIKYVIDDREYVHTTKNLSKRFCKKRRIIKFNISPKIIANLSSGSGKELMKVMAFGPFGSSHKFYPHKCFLAIYSFIKADEMFGSIENPSVRRTKMSRNLKKNSIQTRCQPKLQKINFEDDLDWDYIIAPPSIETKYCSGKCPWILPAHYQPTMAAIIQSQVHSTQPHTIPGLCCVPNKYQNNAIIYLTGESNVRLHKYTDMLVSGCTCK